MSSPKINKISTLQAGYIQTGYSYNDKYNITSGFSIQHTYCLVPRDRFGFGAGIGYISYPEHRLLPMFLKVSTSTKKSLFMDFQAGYSLGWKRTEASYNQQTFGGGLNAAVGLGVKFNTSENYKLYLKSSYRFQVAEIRKEDVIMRNVYYNSFELSFGVLFHQ